MRLVIDCNILVAAGLTDGPCRHAINLAVNRHQIIVSDEIITEYFAVGDRPKFPLDVRERIRSAAHEIARMAQYVDIASFVGPTRIRDPKDVIYVLTASVGGANAILTGDMRDFIDSHYGGARVLSVRQFLDLHP